MDAIQNRSRSRRVGMSLAAEEAMLRQTPVLPAGARVRSRRQGTEALRTACMVLMLIAITVMIGVIYRGIVPFLPACS